MTKQEEKQRLRRVVRGLEERLSPRYLELSGQAIAARLLAMPEYQAAGTVFCFAGAGREVDTRPILENALARGSYPAARPSASPCAPARDRWSCGKSPPWSSWFPGPSAFLRHRQTAP